ncbi:MAG TPA: outer membrane beta-barrel protein [Parafilimonas sp.]
MLKKIIFVCFIIFGCCSFSFSQSDSSKVSPGPTITGSVDAYYRFNFADAKDAEGNPITNNYTSFTNSQNSFELGMVSLQAAHSFGKASVFADLGFGRRAQEFDYPDGSGGNGFYSLASVKQAYLSYAVSDKFKLTIGKWATHVGYELADAYLNRNYSMDYMFSYGPFSHTGLKADIGLGGKSALMLGIANPTDNATTMSSRKFAIAQFSTATSNNKLKAYLNYVGTYGGSLSATQLDLVLIGTVTDKFSIGYNGTVKAVKPDGANNATSWASALYLNVDPSANFGITLRGEYFNDDKDAFGLNTNVFDITLSPNFRIGNLTIIPELRLDNAKAEIFTNHDGNSTKNTFTGILAATYHF